MNKLYMVFCVYPREGRERKHHVQSWACVADSSNHAREVVQATLGCGLNEGPFVGAEWIVHEEDGPASRLRSGMWLPKQIETLKMMGIYS